MQAVVSVSLPVTNLLHKHMNNHQSCLPFSSTRPLPPVLFIKVKPCRNPELCTSLKRLIRLVMLYSMGEKKTVSEQMRVDRDNGDER